MKTEELIDMLARGPDVAVQRPPARDTAVPLLAGVLASMVLMLILLGVRPDLPQAVRLPAFWLKLGFSVALAGAAWWAALRLSVPGARTAAAPPMLATPVIMLWCVAAVALLQAAPETRAALFWGSTWRYCPPLIALLALPLLAAALTLMRARAATRPAWAGAAAGLAAGASAAALYCLHCPEMSAVFVGFWYLLGMLAPAALGALLGRRVLAW